MGLLDAIGFIAIAYFVIVFILWTLLDCDIELFFTTKLGKPISEFTQHFTSVLNRFSEPREKMSF